jgi:cyclase
MITPSNMASSSRREFFERVFRGSVGLSLSCAALSNHAFGQRPPAPITATKLADNLIMITGAGANLMLVLGPDGIVMVDGGLPDRSAELLTLVSAEPEPHKVIALFNTHWHLDHTGSNEALGRAGAKIIAHENTKKWLSSKVFVEAQNRTYDPRPAEAIPTEVFRDTGKMTVGKEQLAYGHLPPAHTDGDIYVHFPGPNILMVSDVLSVARYPIFDYSTNGWIGGGVDATAALLKIADAKTRIIPGAGPVQTKDDLQAAHDMLVVMKDRVVSSIRQGKTLEEFTASAPTKEYDAKWGKPDLFLSMSYKSVLQQQHALPA